MKTRIFIFIIILAMLVACIGHLDSENDFMIRVGTGFRSVPVKIISNVG